MGGHGGATPRPVEEPIPTVTAKNGCIHYIDPEAFILPRKGRQRGNRSNPAQSIDDPLHTVTAKNHDGRKFEACLVPLYNERPDQKPRIRSPGRPLNTVPASKGPAGVSRPFLVKYYGQSDVADLKDALPTVTAAETLALCVPEYYPWGLDVRYRMLTPRECARAQGLPDHYEFASDTVGNTRELIGNAVPVNLARELCRSLLEPTEAPTLNYYGKTPQPTVAEGGADDD
jgi:Site-specific DNA methylase